MTIPIDIRYLDNGTGVLHVGRGLLSAKDIVGAKSAAFASDDRRRYRYGLIDYSPVDNVLISSRELEAVAAYDRKAATIVPGIPVAIVGVKKFVFGLARMWEAFMHGAGWETHVFRSRGEAEAWIREKHGNDPAFT